MSKIEQMAIEMENEVKIFAQKFSDDPKHQSAWGHHYFCEKDGTALIFNPENENEHKCPLCQTTYESKLYKEVWRYIYRNNAAVTVLKAAALYKRTREKNLLKIILDISQFYIYKFEEFPLHNKEGLYFNTYEEMQWGCGRIMPQNLNESIFFIRIFMALELVKKDLPKEFIEYIKNTFASQIFELLKSQVVKIHNISCWMNNAIGVIGLFSSRQDLIQFAFEGPYNNRRQLLEGVTEDGFWYEGSIHYNFFTLEGFMYLGIFAQRYKYTFDEVAVLEKMLKAAYKYAFSNHILPNPNDGWPNINLKTYSYIYSMGVQIFGDNSETAQILRAILNNDSERVELPLSKPYYYNNEISLERFIFIPKFEMQGSIKKNDETTNFAASNFIILKNKTWNVFLKYGHHGPSHAHPDKMSIEVSTANKLITRDLSNAGYGAVICNEWHRKTPSHSTVIVDGTDHTSVEPGRLIDYTQESCVTQATKVYKDVDFKRSIKISETTLIDQFECNSNEVRTYDYVFHNEGNITEESLNKYKWISSDLGYADNGYQYYENVMKLDEESKEFVLDWQIKDLQLQSVFNTEDCEIYLAWTPDNPVNKLRRSLLIRKKMKNAVFYVTWIYREEKKYD
ncbi:heparinase II/III family protein [Vallitaleaceae bacterium 9-2]